jgi:hypothetical protein
MSSGITKDKILSFLVQWIAHDNFLDVIGKTPASEALRMVPAAST